MHLLKITVGTLIALLLGVGIIRFYSLNQPHPTYNSGFLPEPLGATTQAFLLPSPEQKIWTQESLIAVTSSHPQVIIYAGVTKTAAGDLVIGRRDKDSFIGLESKALPLGVALEIAPQTRFILDILDNVENIHELVASRVKTASAAKRVLITSEFDVVIRATKDLVPNAMYGSSIADRMRFNTFNSMFILVAVPFKGDAYITAMNHRKISVLNLDIANELKRRNKPLFLGPVSEEEWDAAIQFKPAAIGSDNLELLVKKLNL